MSCYPKWNSSSESKLYFSRLGAVIKAAEFGAFSKSKSLPKNLTKDRVDDLKLPRYMQASKSTLRRNREAMRERERLAQKKEEEKVESFTVLPLKPTSDHLGMNQRTKLLAAASKKKPDFSAVNNTTNDPGNTSKPAVLVDDDIKKDVQVVKPTEVKFDDVHDMASEPAASRQPRKPPVPKRTGNEDSFSFRKQFVKIDKFSAKRAYRILTYVTKANGDREVMDIPDGYIYYCRTGPQKRRITPDAVAYDTKELAMSERFPYDQIGAARSGNGTLPRILVAFDGWGKTHRRVGGGGSAKYEYLKFIRIERFLDAPESVSGKQSELASHPHYFGKIDRRPRSRKAIDKAIYMDRTFDTTPWRKEKNSIMEDLHAMDKRECVEKLVALGMNPFDAKKLRKMEMINIIRSNSPQVQ